MAHIQLKSVSGRANLEHGWWQMNSSNLVVVAVVGTEDIETVAVVVDIVLGHLDYTLTVAEHMDLKELAGCCSNFLLSIH